MGIQHTGELLCQVQQIGLERKRFAGPQPGVVEVVVTNGVEFSAVDQFFQHLQLGRDFLERLLALGMIENLVEFISVHCGSERLNLVVRGLRVWIEQRLAYQRGGMNQRSVFQGQVDGIKVMQGQVQLRQGMTQAEQRVRNGHAHDGTVRPGFGQGIV